MTTVSSQQIEWLSLIDSSGPFLSTSVLDDTFPQGLEPVEKNVRRRLKAAYEEWTLAVYESDPLLLELHQEWIKLVLTELLQFDEDSLVEVSADISSTEGRDAPLVSPQVERQWKLKSPLSKDVKLHVIALPPPSQSDGLTNNPISKDIQEQVSALCHTSGVRVALVTNGEQWMLVNATKSAATGYSSWYSRFWFQEPLTLRAFQTLLNLRRWFGPPQGSLDALLEASAEDQDDVTLHLGEQVRRAVEVLVQALDRADEDRNRELLNGIPPATLYEAGLTVMMRLVFILCAEERGLLLLGDSTYDESYALSTLRGQLEEDADKNGQEVLERKHDAWSRVLALFRVIYSGIEHEDLRMPALGGSLFDPDRFAFLEGRKQGEAWQGDDSTPLPIDNRTVLLLLNALQILERPQGALHLSYRSLDVEQIGYVYEGLLDHTVVRCSEVTIGLKGSKKHQYPYVTLSALETAAKQSASAVEKLISELTGRKIPSIRADIKRSQTRAASQDKSQILIADSRIAEYVDLVRTDVWHQPVIYQPGALMVTSGTDRQESGTHYTPPFLTELIVRSTLEPLVYCKHGERESEEARVVRSPEELLDLKICDPAMGSGAFLVQACRYIGDRLVESWMQSEQQGFSISAQGAILPPHLSNEVSDLMPKDPEERLIIARRLVAERSLYGVDTNPIAVELAKLSIWLVTMAKGKPLGFLDHSLKVGNSLIGITDLNQVSHLHMKPGPGTDQAGFVGHKIEAILEEVIKFRSYIRSQDPLDIDDVEKMATWNLEATRRTRMIGLIADALVVSTILSKGKVRTLARELDQLSLAVEGYVEGDVQCEAQIQNTAAKLDAITPFHWALEYPEVFTGEKGAFDAVISNPPYVNAVERSLVESAELKKYYSDHYESASGSYDLFVLFCERAIQLATEGSYLGLLIPNKVLSVDYAKKLRKILIRDTNLLKFFDFTRVQVFSASVYPIVLISSLPQKERDLVVLSPSEDVLIRPSQESLRAAPDLLWSYLLDDYAELLAEALERTEPLSSIFNVSASATVNEAYEIAPHVVSNTTPVIPEGHARFIVSGNIRPGRTTWRDAPVQYIKNSYRLASVPLSALPSNRRHQVTHPKVIMSGMSKRPTAYFDEAGQFCSGVSTVIIMEAEGTSDHLTMSALTDIINSRVAALIYRGLYGALALQGGYLNFGPPQVSMFPIPIDRADLAQVEHLTEADIARLYGLDADIVEQTFAQVFTSPESP